MQSSIVVDGNDIKASEYNNLRLDMPAIGLITMWGTTSAPTDWLLCIGQGLDTTTYADLFAVIGYTFGGAGATFNLPDLQERIPIGKSGTYAIGDTGGGAITLATSNLPAHVHSIATDLDHNHEVKGYSSSGTDFNTVLQGASTAGPTLTSQGAGGHNHTAATGSTGSGAAFNVIPEYLALNYIIKY